MLVATVTDDARLFDVPKLRVCALRFTETARARIVKVWKRISRRVVVADAVTAGRSRGAQQQQQQLSTVGAGQQHITHTGSFAFTAD